jgi:hypothetical protein
VEVYKSETREVIRRFRAHRLSFPEFIAALDAALAGLVFTLAPEDVDALRAQILANNEIVMQEMERQGVLSDIRKAASEPSGESEDYSPYA